jgi:hypothetical protein
MCVAIGWSVDEVDRLDGWVLCLVRSIIDRFICSCIHPIDESDPNPAPPAQYHCTPGAESIEAALKGADVIVVPAGVPRKPGMTRDDLFNINASIVKTIAEASAKASPLFLPFVQASLHHICMAVVADRPVCSGFAHRLIRTV